METHHLGRGELLRLEDARGTLVRVESGCIWVTEEGNVRDRFVAAGDSFPIGSPGVTLISALTTSAITLAETEAALS